MSSEAFKIILHDLVLKPSSGISVIDLSGPILITDGDGKLLGAIANEDYFAQHREDFPGPDNKLDFEWRDGVLHIGWNGAQCT